MKAKLDRIRKIFLKDLSIASLPKAPTTKAKDGSPGNKIEMGRNGGGASILDPGIEIRAGLEGVLGGMGEFKPEGGCLGTRS